VTDERLGDGDLGDGFDDDSDETRVVARRAARSDVDDETRVVARRAVADEPDDATRVVPRRVSAEPVEPDDATRVVARRAPAEPVEPDDATRVVPRRAPAEPDQPDDATRVVPRRAPAQPVEPDDATRVVSRRAPVQPTDQPDDATRAVPRSLPADDPDDDSTRIVGRGGASVPDGATRPRDHAAPSTPTAAPTAGRRAPVADGIPILPAGRSAVVPDAEPGPSDVYGARSVAEPARVERTEYAAGPGRHGSVDDVLAARPRSSRRMGGTGIRLVALAVTLVVAAGVVILALQILR
jgi:hypothetical protein